ncbi:MAG: diguanylate cyclase [Desulfobulbus sp.]
MARSTHNQSNLSLFMLDIDHFKLDNDQYGHLLGDDCIRDVARVLEQQLNQPTDLAARYGGEEFVILLSTDTDMKGTCHIAERIRAAIKTLFIPHLKSKNAPVVPISMGVVPCRPTLPLPQHH